MTDFNFALGVLQAIGFKEFAPILDAMAQSGLEITRASVAQHPAFKESVEEMRRGTRRYARRQMAWLRGRMFSRNLPHSLALLSHSLFTSLVNVPGLDIYQVDSSDLGTWPEQKSLAVSIMAAVNAGQAASVSAYHALYRIQ